MNQLIGVIFNEAFEKKINIEIKIYIFYEKIPHWHEPK